MNAVEFLAYLESLGVALVAEGDRLRVNAARGQLSDELKVTIGARKAELLPLLAGRSGGRPPGIPQVSRDVPLPLSFFQERLWVLNRLEPDSTAYNLVSLWPSDGPVDAGRLASALRVVVQRHEILRTAFRDNDGAPAGFLLPPESVPVQVLDIRDRSHEEQLSTLRAAIAAAATVPFDLATEPPVRFALYLLADGRAATLVAAHHIAVDAWSIGLLGREIAATYADAGVVPPPPVLQYADYAASQRSALDPAAIAAELDWWEKRLAGIPQLSVFPADRAPCIRPMGATHEFRWSTELLNGIRALARENGATVYMALLAACATVLQRHTGQTDIVLGSPMGMRERPEFESMIGPFVNLLVVRLDLSDDPSFAELLKRAREAVLEAHAHRQVPFEKLVERLKPARSFNHSPLFQVAVVQHNAPEAGRTPIFGGGAINELTWFVRDGDGRLEGSLEYRSDLYAAETVAQVAAHLHAVLSGAVLDSNRRLGELPLLTPDERQRVVGQFNATAVATDPATVAAQFERQVAATPAAVAVGFEGAALSYAELNRQANQLAHRLRSLGIAPGVLVGICLHRSAALVVALLGIQKAGGAYVPLDPGFPPERLGFMLADSGASVLVTADNAAAGVDVPEGVRILNLGEEEAALGRMSTENLDGVAGPEDVAYVIYTSGSTGRPKGVVVSHGALANFLGSMLREPGLTAADVLAAVTTISFDIAALELYLPLIVGARIELMSRETAADGTALAAQLAASGATVLQATPATWRLLLEADWRGSPGFRALCGGEALTRDLADALLERTHELWNLYGPTETTIWSTVERVERATGPITIGHPIANTQVYVLDRAAQPVPVGIPGEIWIGGAGVALGYHRRPELTAERFVPDHLGVQAESKLYRTGDLGRWLPDGRLEHLGRMDNQVKIRGFRIEPGEIEAVLSAHAAVRQAVVIPREAGPGDLRLIAYVVFQTGEDLTVSEVRRHIRRALPDYMVPSVVVALEAIPLTPNRKVDRAALPDPFKNVAQEVARHEPPAAGMEQLLADIWQEILKIEHISAEDNFFELGGHSLLSLRVSAAVNKRVGWRMDPRALFFQTLRQVAASAPESAIAGTRQAGA